MDNVVWLGWLYKFDAKGSLKRWRCGTNGNQFVAEYGTMWLANGSEGKLRRTPAKAISGNAREQDANTQARNYADQEWREKQRKDAYFPSAEPPTCTPEQWLEMHNDERKWPAVCLAWKDCAESDKVCSVARPWLCQYKVDGDRRTAWYTEDSVQMYSRKCLEAKFNDHLREQMMTLFHLIHFLKTGNEEHYTCYDFGLDGEIWNPKLGSHQQSHSVSARTVNRHANEKEQCFAWFDIIDYKMTAQERFDLIQQVKELLSEEYGGNVVVGDQTTMCIGGDLPNIFIVPSKVCTSEDEMVTFYDQAKANGFEGAVARRPQHMYPRQREHKTSMMIKMKPFEDAEFEIVGYKSGEADREGCVVWKCRNNINDEIFSTQQMGDVEYQRELYDMAEEFIGSKITVRFDGRSDKGIPVKPRAVRYRAEEDMP